MKLGTKVKLVVPDIEGTVTDARWSAKDAKLQVLVDCTDGNQRWFEANTLTVTEEPKEG